MIGDEFSGVKEELSKPKSRSGGGGGLAYGDHHPKSGHMSHRYISTIRTDTTSLGDEEEDEIEEPILAAPHPHSRHRRDPYHDQYQDHQQSKSSSLAVGTTPSSYAISRAPTFPRENATSRSNSVNYWNNIAEQQMLLQQQEQKRQEKQRSKGISYRRVVSAELNHSFSSSAGVPAEQAPFLRQSSTKLKESTKETTKETTKESKGPLQQDFLEHADIDEGQADVDHIDVDHDEHDDEHNDLEINSGNDNNSTKKDQTKETTTQQRKRRRNIIWYSLLALGIICICVGAFLIGLYASRKRNSNTRQSTTTTTNNAGPTTTNTFGSQCSYLSTTTTRTNSNDNTNPSVTPNPLNQCYCNGQITILSQFVQQRYLALKSQLGVAPTLGGEPQFSCAPKNLALAWLAATTIGPDDENNNGALVVLEDNHPRLYIRYVLAYFYVSFLGPHWQDDQNWVTTTHECKWFGVQCTADDDEQTITGLHLMSNKLQGIWDRDMATMLARLNLESIELNDNQIRGNLIFVPEMISLKRLSLDSNLLSGTVPTSLGNLVRLEQLTLTHNNLLGNQLLDTVVSRLTRLQRLEIQHNLQLSGTIPDAIGERLSLLKIFRAELTDLSGTLPTSLGLLTSLQTFNVDSLRRLGGQLPTEIGMCTDLVSFDFGTSALSGTIPSQMGKLTKLKGLGMQLTKLEGTLPTELGLLTLLTDLDLLSTNLEGTIPVEMGNMTSIERINLSKNKAIVGNLPVELAFLPELQFLNVLQTSLTGQVPNEFCNPVQGAMPRICVPPTSSCNCCRELC